MNEPTDAAEGSTRMSNDQDQTKNSPGTSPNASKDSLSSSEGESRSDSQGSSLEEDLKQKVQVLEEQLKEKDAKYLYLYAEFENFKKRFIKERSDLIKFGWEPVARELLQDLDNLERALLHAPNGVEPAWIKGLNMTLDHFKAALQKQGVQPVESLNKEFDPNVHEAVGQEASDLPSGTIIKEHSSGYTLHGRLLRPARVVISGGKSSQ